MRRASLLALLLAACSQTPAAPPEFDVAKLEPTPDSADDIQLVGFLHLGDPMRLYTTLAGLKSGKDDGCIAVQPLSTAGITTKDYEAKRMMVTGRIQRMGTSCGGLTLLAADISAP